jgi:sugar phosphate isomerase/epimerase
MLLGFNTGRPEKFTWSDKIDIFKELHATAIEFSCMDDKRWELMKELKADDIKFFKYVSIHAPTERDFIDDSETHSILEKIEQASKKFDVDHVVFHPHEIKDWNIFNKYSFSVAIENMDTSKQSCRSVEDLINIFKKQDIKMVLDVNHCYANDNSLKLAREMYKNFRELIVEIHLSGYSSNHDRLYETKQAEIIKAIQDTEAPIIIESPMRNRQDIMREFNYIKNNLIG